MTSLLDVEPAPERNGRVRIPAPVFYGLVTVASLALSAFVGYAAAQSAMNARVSVLESQYQGLHSDIQDIKADVKALLRRP
jgi:hypothetical protein